MDLGPGSWGLVGPGSYVLMGPGSYVLLVPGSSWFLGPHGSYVLQGPICPPWSWVLLGPLYSGSYNWVDIIHTHLKLNVYAFLT